jgi:REP element-mobilizing transposase RayT
VPWCKGFWYEIPKHFDHVQLGEFVVMPNHVHGILLLSKMDGWDDTDPTTPVETPHCDVSTGVVERDKRNAPGFYKKITPKSGSVSTIIGSFKSVCTKHIRKSFSDLNFKWQERFHDHIIRDESSFHRISNYIINNPATWQEDKFFRPS